MVGENGSDENLSQIVECPFSGEKVGECSGFNYGMTNLGEGCGSRVLKKYQSGSVQKIICRKF